MRLLNRLLRSGLTPLQARRVLYEIRRLQASSMPFYSIELNPRAVILYTEVSEPQVFEVFRRPGLPQVSDSPPRSVLPELTGRRVS